MSSSTPRTRHNQIDIKPLLILGGQSTRMGKPKHLLLFPDGRTALEHALDTLRAAIPHVTTVYLSLRDESQLEAIKPLLPTLTTPSQIHPLSTPLNDETPGAKSSHTTTTTTTTNTFQKAVILYDQIASENIGPAAGLLAAHDLHLDSTWLILGCDYPLLPASALLQLILEYTEPLTCFAWFDDRGRKWTEPLISIWGPTALQALRTSVRAGITGPNRVVSSIGAKEIRSLRSEWIKGANTPEEWLECLEILKEL